MEKTDRKKEREGEGGGGRACTVFLSCSDRRQETPIRSWMRMKKQAKREEFGGFPPLTGYQFDGNVGGPNVNIDPLRERVVAASLVIPRNFPTHRNPLPLLKIKSLTFAHFSTPPFAEQPMSAISSRIASGAARSPLITVHQNFSYRSDSHRRSPAILISHRKNTIVVRSRTQQRISCVDSLTCGSEILLESNGDDDTDASNLRTFERCGNVLEVKEQAAVEKQEICVVEVAVAMVATVVLGVGNRVLYKLALVPLKHYPFFLAQLATLGYVVVYFSIMHLRRHAGIVTDEMLSLPKAPFVAVGFVEALAAASGMASVTMLPGASIPIFSQTFLIWQLLLSIVFLGKRYTVNQMLGCFLVAVGVIITVASGLSSRFSLKAAGAFWSLLMIVSFLLQAAGTVLKEVIFLDARKRLKGGSVDLFVVNSFGSAYQAVFICLLLPLLSKMWGIPFTQLPSYLMDGTACFLNINSSSIGCEGAPLLPLLFIVVNMGFNVSLLYLLKVSSAVVSSLASTFSVPLSIYVFTLPLPYLGMGSPLPPGFVAGVLVLTMGMLIYTWRPALKPARSTSAS
ncbi:hypothetical protein V2J09_006194 [Rumex salicifolius]